MAEKRVNYSSGAPLEEKVGYSRMIKIGDHIYVGGTPALNRPTQFVEIMMEAVIGCGL